MYYHEELHLIKWFMLDTIKMQKTMSWFVFPNIYTLTPESPTTARLVKPLHINQSLVTMKQPPDTEMIFRFWLIAA